MTRKKSKKAFNYTIPNFGFRVGAEPFVPHNFGTKLVSKWHKEPTILITPDSYMDMHAIAKNAGHNEIGWLGTVSDLGNGEFLIDGIYMPAQDVHGTTCELTEDGLGEYFTDLASINFDACSRMLFWGHVHPGNSTSPSHQDDKQMTLFDHNDWFIRGIFGRHGRAEFTFFDYKNDVQWDDVAWRIHYELDVSKEEEWKLEIDDKVNTIPYIPASTSFPNNINGINQEEEPLNYDV